MDIGLGFDAEKVIVLGQEKCKSLNTPTSRTHIARTFAKLKRGWLGVYVTISYFIWKSNHQALFYKLRVFNKFFI